MAKTIKAEMIIRGKAAREFEKKYILNAELDPAKTERNKKDLAFYRANKVVR
jgi:hypothetical protein